jgi:hypothetical protein
MRITKPITVIDKQHGKALEALEKLSTRVEQTAAQLEDLRSQRSKVLESHGKKVADALVEDKPAPAAPDVAKLDRDVEILEGVHRELAKRRRVLSDEEIAARLRGLDAALGSERKQHAGLLKAVADHEQAILQCKSDAEASLARQADLREQITEAERLAGGERVCAIVGDLDTLAACVEDPAVLIDRVEARKHLAWWRDGAVELEVQSIEMKNHFREKRIVVQKAGLFFDRLTGKILDAPVLEWRASDSDITNFDRIGPEGYVRAWEQQIRVQEHQEAHNVH